jgi:hypothetical protein
MQGQMQCFRDEFLHLFSKNGDKILVKKEAIPIIKIIMFSD